MLSALRALQLKCRTRQRSAAPSNYRRSWQMHPHIWLRLYTLSSSTLMSFSS